jgi:hypothetical protein
MDFSQVDDIDDLLGSLTVGAKLESGEYELFVIYPDHRYTMCPGADLCMWYKAALKASFEQLRALIQGALVKGGLGASSRFADAALFAYAITEPTDNRTDVIKAPSNEDWRKRWLAVLDYLYGACCVELPPEASALLESGIRRVSFREGAEEDAARKYGKIE